MAWKGRSQACCYANATGGSHTWPPSLDSSKDFPPGRVPGATSQSPTAHFLQDYADLPPQPVPQPLPLNVEARPDPNGSASGILAGVSVAQLAGLLCLLSALPL